MLAFFQLQYYYNIILVHYDTCIYPGMKNGEWGMGCVQCTLSSTEITQCNGWPANNAPSAVVAKMVHRPQDTCFTFWLMAPTKKIIPTLKSYCYGGQKRIVTTHKSHSSLAHALISLSRWPSRLSSLFSSMSLPPSLPPCLFHLPPSFSPSFLSPSHAHTYLWYKVDESCWYSFRKRISHLHGKLITHCLHWRYRCAIVYNKKSINSFELHKPSERIYNS